MAQEREGGERSVNESSVARMVQEREAGTNKNGVVSPSPRGGASAGLNAAAIHRVKLARRRARRHAASGVDSSDSADTSSAVSEKDEVDNDKDGQRQKSSSNRIMKVAQSKISNGAATNDNDDNCAVDGALLNAPSVKYHVGLMPSLLTDFDDATIDSSVGDVTETQLYKKFEEAFHMTLRNNPGILPGEPIVVDSIKVALFKLQSAKAERESDMRKQLDKAKGEKDQLEAQLRKEMVSTALLRSELTNELEVLQKEKVMLQDSLKKQMEAIVAVKKEMQLKMDRATEEKEELTKHLGFLSKSRADLEQALETEMEIVEKDRDALQKVVEERKGLQKHKAENKGLETKIERMTQAVNKEKKALLEEVSELKKFEDHLAQMRKGNESTRNELERTKSELKSIADEMQTKKSALLESKAKLEQQYQEEIDNLEGQMQNTKMMHQQDMEMMVRNRVMNYLRKGCGDLKVGITGPETFHQDVVAENQHSRQIGSPCPQDTPLDIEWTDMHSIGRRGMDHLNHDLDSLIKTRVEAEIKRRMEASEVEVQSRMKAEAEVQSRMQSEAELRSRIEAEMFSRMEAERAVMQSRIEAEFTKKKEDRRKKKNKKRAKKDPEFESDFESCDSEDEKQETTRNNARPKKKKTPKEIGCNSDDNHDDMQERGRKAKAMATQTKKVVKRRINDDTDCESVGGDDDVIVNEQKAEENKASGKSLISNNGINGDDLRQEIDQEIKRLREEFKLIRAGNLRHSKSPLSRSSTIVESPETRGNEAGKIKENIKLSVSICDEDNHGKAVEIIHNHQELELVQAGNLRYSMPPPSRTRSDGKQSKEYESKGEKVNESNREKENHRSSFPSKSSSKGDEMMREIDRLREELKQVQARSPGNSVSLTRDLFKNDVRDEIENNFRNSFRMRQAAATPTSPNLSPCHGEPTQRNSKTLPRDNALTSPRTIHNQVPTSSRGMSYGNNRSSYFWEEDDRRRHSVRQSLISSPVSHRSQPTRQQVRAPNSLNARYYF